MTTPLTDKESVERLEAIKARVEKATKLEPVYESSGEVEAGNFQLIPSGFRFSPSAGLDLWTNAADDLKFLMALLESSRERVKAGEKLAEAAGCKKCFGFGTYKRDCSDPQCGDSTWDHMCDIETIRCEDHIPVKEALVAFRTPARKGAGA